MQLRRLSVSMLLVFVGIIAVVALAPSGAQNNTPEGPPPTKLIDTMWLWLNPPLEPDEDYMGIPNIMVATPTGDSQPSLADTVARVEQEAGGRVACDWLSPGEGFDFTDSLGLVQTVARQSASMEAVILDDMSTGTIKGEGMKPEALSRLCRAIQAQPRPLSLVGVVYTMSTEPDSPHYVPNLPDYMRFLNVVLLAEWHGAKLPQLEESLARCNELSGGKPVILCLYLHDFGGGRPMPLDMMELQCETARRWLHEGRIMGVVFAPSFVRNDAQDTEAVEWARQWIERVGHEPL